MDNSLEELENELSRLSPRRPSAALLDRLEHELGPVTPAPAVRRYVTATSLRSWKWAGWSLAGAAAALALVFAAQSQFTREPAVSTPAPAPVQVAAAVPANRYQPVKATSVLYDLKEDGVATLPDQTEGRQVRYRYVDTYTWRNPATKASLRWSVPRDEVRLVRASLN